VSVLPPSVPIGPAPSRAVWPTAFGARLAAILAVYAMVLQAVLGAAVVAAQAGSRHEPVLCAPLATGGETPSAPTQSHRHPCCLVACRAGAPPPEVPELSDPDVTVRAVVYDRPPSAAAPIRHPITGSARGPPLS
jgi:hypothetical protein